LRKGGGLRMPLGQRIAHMRPEGCLGILDPLRKDFVDAGDRHLEVVGRTREAVSTPSAGSIPEDVPELPQAIPPARELFRHDLELAGNLRLRIERCRLDALGKCDASAPSKRWEPPGEDR